MPIPLPLPRYSGKMADIAVNFPSKIYGTLLPAPHFRSIPGGASSKRDVYGTFFQLISPLSPAAQPALVFFRPRKRETPGPTGWFGRLRGILWGVVGFIRVVSGVLLLRPRRATRFSARPDTSTAATPRGKHIRPSWPGRPPTGTAGCRPGPPGRRRREVRRR